jgi:predicted amidohydrolase YtcJ
MSPPETLFIRDAEIEGRPHQDVRIEGGVIAEVGPRLAGRGQELDAKGGALIPGLIDHHIHLLATAAQADSLALEGVTGPGEFAARLRAFAAGRPPGAWLRVTGYHERMAGELDAAVLDALAPAHPVRVQHQTGALWVLNGAALARVATGETPPSLERDAAGAPTGRLWRGDDWLRTRIGQTVPPLAPLGAMLAARGITGVMDATAATTAEDAAVLAAAVRAGDLPLRLALMSAGPLEAPADGAFLVGPVKVLLDDHDPPPLDDFVDRIRQARAWGRPVAVHCVTALQLALTLAAFDGAGSRPGDRIAPGAIPELLRLGLAVVTQPGFVFERGDRYLAEVDPAEHPDLYRCASLLAAGVPVAGSSDAPYSAPDPWAQMRAAVERRTRGGAAIGLEERVAAGVALGLFLGALRDPAGQPRRVAPGAKADLCLLRAPLAEALEALQADLVAATVAGGKLVGQPGEAPGARG